MVIAKKSDIILTYLYIVFVNQKKIGLSESISSRLFKIILAQGSEIFYNFVKRLKRSIWFKISIIENNTTVRTQRK